MAKEITIECTCGTTYSFPIKDFEDTLVDGNPNSYGLAMPCTNTSCYSRPIGFMTRDMIARHHARPTPMRYKVD
jgi:hypothetical protein